MQRCSASVLTPDTLPQLNLAFSSYASVWKRMQVLTKTGSSSRCPVFQMIGCSGWSGGSQQTGVPTPPAAKSAPLRKRGWRPSVQQSKLNHQMCLCSKYLSPAGYYLSPDGVWAHSLQKNNQALLMWCEKPSLFLPQCMNTWSTYKNFTERRKEKFKNSFFHAGLGNLYNQGRCFAFVISNFFQWSRGSITALLICS